MRRGYLIVVDGAYRHTRYTPEQTAAVRQGMAAGLPLDAIAAQTGIPYSSLGYVAAMEHKSRALPLEDATCDDA